MSEDTENKTIPIDVWWAMDPLIGLYGTFVMKGDVRTLGKTQWECVEAQHAFIKTVPVRQLSEEERLHKFDKDTFYGMEIYHFSTELTSYGMIRKDADGNLWKQVYVNRYVPYVVVQEYKEASPVAKKDSVSVFKSTWDSMKITKIPKVRRDGSGRRWGLVRDRGDGTVEVKKLHDSNPADCDGAEDKGSPFSVPDLRLPVTGATGAAAQAIYDQAKKLQPWPDESKPSEEVTRVPLFELNSYKDVTLYDCKRSTFPDGRRVEVYQIKDDPDALAIQIFRPIAEGKESFLQFGLSKDAARELSHLILKSVTPLSEGAVEEIQKQAKEIQSRLELTDKAMEFIRELEGQAAKLDPVMKAFREAAYRASGEFGRAIDRLQHTEPEGCSDAEMMDQAAEEARPNDEGKGKPPVTQPSPTR